MKKTLTAETRLMSGFSTKKVSDTVVKAKKSLRRLFVNTAVVVTTISLIISGVAPFSNIREVNAASVAPTVLALSNPEMTCANLDNTYANGQTWSEAKVDSNALSNGVKNFAGISVTISNYTSNSFDFTSTIGVDAVLVKAGSTTSAGGHNFYVYQPSGSEVTADTNLVTYGQQGISHITFCFDVEVVEEEDTKLTLVKQLAGDETEDEVSDWLLEADGPDHIGPAATGDAEITDAVVQPGTYTLAENGPTEGYTASDWECFDDQQNEVEVTNEGNDVTLEEGDDVTCIITNTFTQEDPEVPNLHFIKVVCEEYSDVEGNDSADQRDDTGNKYSEFWNSPNWGTVDKPVNPFEIPKNCERADGWEFKLSTGVANDYQDQVDNIQVVGPTVNGEYVTDAYGENSDLNEALQNGIQNGSFWVSEVEQNGYGFAAIRCYNDALNGDNLEFVNIGQDFQGSDIYCIAYNVDTDVEVPCEEGPSWAAEVVDNNQGLRKNGTAVLAGRSDPNLATGVADWVSGTGTDFYALGFGGDITLSFAGYVTDEIGDDLSIHEATNGAYPNETVKIEVSKDGSNWYTLSEQGTNTSPAGVTYVDFSETGLNWIKFVKLTDTSVSASFPADADGFDLDAVDATNQECEPPVIEEECEELEIVDRITKLIGENTEGVQCSISGHKYRDSDGSGTINPGDELLQGWEIWLDNDGQCLYGQEGDSEKQLTDTNGYYEFNNLDSGIYYVCEGDETGWEQILPDNGVDSDNRWAHKVTLTDSSVENVDFLNQETPREECELPEQEVPTIFSAILDFVNDAVVQDEDPTCAISGHKYEDTVENGLIDNEGEDQDATVEGWEITLATDENCENVVATDLTDSNGYYEFTDLEAGTYYVCEEQRDNWSQLIPAQNGNYMVELLYASHHDKDFLNIDETPEPCKEPVTLNLVSGSNTDTAGSTAVNPSATPLVAASYEGIFGDASTASPVIPPWVDPTSGSFAGSGAVWVSTSTDHPGAGDEGSSTVDQWRLFQHSFNIPDADSIEESTLYFTADNAVTVYLNGDEISATPVSTFGANAFPVDANYDDTYSVSFTPVEGDNTLSFVVRNSGGEYGPSNPTGLLYATSVTYTPECDETPPGGGGSNGGGGSSGSSRRPENPPGQVLGDSTSLPYVAPQVLGASTLPVTGNSTQVLLLVAVLAVISVFGTKRLAVEKQPQK